MPKNKIENADALSRLQPAKDMKSEECNEDEYDVLLLENGPEKPINDKLLAKRTVNDIVLGQVIKFVKTAWPERVPETLQPF